MSAKIEVVNQEKIMVLSIISTLWGVNLMKMIQKKLLVC